jgi:hypothetical protein
MATPASAPSTPAAVGANKLSQFFSGTAHAAGINDIIANVLTAWNKIGYSESSAQDSPLANTSLISLTVGKSKYGKCTKSQLVTGSGSNLTTTSGTYVDLDSATMSTSYVSSGGILIAVVIATLGQSATGGDYSRLGVSINGTDFIGTSHANSTSNFRGAAIAIGRTSGLAAGTYTIKPRFHTSTATTTTALSVGGERFMLILELVTGS